MNPTVTRKDRVENYPAQQLVAVKQEYLSVTVDSAWHTKYNSGPTF